jgi:hypothetical protein
MEEVSKGNPEIGHEGTDGEQKFSCTLSLFLVLDGTGCSLPCLPTEETCYVSYRRLGGFQSWSGWQKMID